VEEKEKAGKQELKAEIEKATKGMDAGDRSVVDKVLGLIAGSDVSAALNLVKEFRTESSSLINGVISRQGQFKALKFTQDIETRTIPSTNKPAVGKQMAERIRKLPGLSSTWACEMATSVENYVSAGDLQSERQVIEFAYTGPGGSMSYLAVALYLDPGNHEITHVRYAYATASFEVAPDLVVWTETRKRFLNSSTRQVMREMSPTISAAHLVTISTFMVHSRNLLGINTPPPPLVTGPSTSEPLKIEPYVPAFRDDDEGDR